MGAICGLGTVAVLVLHEVFKPLQRWEVRSQDLRTRLGRKTPIDPRLVFIGIDKLAYADVPLEFDPDAAHLPVLQELRKKFPWSREVWAELIERLMKADASVVALDIVFASPAEGDDALARILEKHKDRVVVGCFFEVAEKAAGGGTSITQLLPSPSILPAPTGQSIALDPRVGYASIWADEDNIFRHASYRTSEAGLYRMLASEGFVETGAQPFESLAARMLRQGRRPELIPAVDHSPLFRYAGGPGEFRVHSLEEVFRPKTWANNYQNGGFFRDKIVLVGPAHTLFHDQHVTPFKFEMLGPEIHLNMINAALHGEFFDEGTKFTSRVTVIIAGLLAAFLCLRIRQPNLRLALLLALSGIYWLVSQWLFDHANLVILVVSPLIVVNFCGVFSLSYDFIAERIERFRLRTTMSFYFSPRVLQEVLANPGAMEPRHAHVTALLTDLRNSTPLAERLGPQGMFQLLNRVFEMQTAAIMGEEGNLEHFLGDQFLSYWGAPQAQPDATDRALRAGLKLIEGMEKLKETFEPEVKKLFGYGVAIHCGPVLVGNKGSAQRLDYGLVGDTINEAARVEALTKFYGVTFLMTREAFSQSTQPPPSRLIDRVIVKGKSVPVDLIEPRNPRSASDFAALVRDYEAAFQDYTAGRFAAAQPAFQALADQHQDGASRQLAERCAGLAASPPPDWDGIWRMESK